MTAGAQDVLVAQEFTEVTLRRAIEYARERKHLERRLTRLAYYDPLTGVANRALFRKRAAETLARAGRERRPVALCVLDLDHFKQVNDRFGHDVGDALLQLAAERMKSCIREYDLVGRLGGDEFGILIELGEDPEALFFVLTRLDSTLKEPCRVLGHRITPSASLGCAVYPDDGQTTDELFRRADKRMYREKHRSSARSGLHSAVPWTFGPRRTRKT
jgi:diguanylate cyclase (GGDEF)-like protein